MAEVNLRPLSPIFISPCIITLSDLPDIVLYCLHIHGILLKNGRGAEI